VLEAEEKHCKSQILSMEVSLYSFERSLMGINAVASVH